MIGQEAIGANAHRPALQGLSVYPFEGQVILVLVKQRSPAHAPIEDMKNHSTTRKPSRSSHTEIVSFDLQIGGCHLFFSVTFSSPEGGVVGRFVKKRGTPDGPIEDVVKETGIRAPRASRHGAIVCRRRDGLSIET